MSLGCVGLRRLRWAALLSIAAVLGSTAHPSDAEARRGKHRRGHAVARSVYAPPFSAMVVDAKTGRVMHAVAENELRHPASVTKVMTLYLLFEQLERGNLKLDSDLTVSRHAASMAPSKLGLKPGETIEVEDAIKAIVTRSANDVAAAIAENIAGDEDEFAERMTRKARQLGMRRTVYRNASGLPDAEQVTTARDLVILARAIQERFPHYYPYFQTRSFEYAGQTIGNHNHLLGRVEGVDGIKTGFTNASGFNLMTSARLDGRHVVGVILGGRSGASRDAMMASLIRTNLARASTSGHASVFAEAAESGEGGTRVASADPEDVETTAAIPAEPRRAVEAAAARVQAVATPAPVALGTARASSSVVAKVASAVEVAEPRPAPRLGVKIDGRLPAMPAAPTPPAPPGRPDRAVAKPAPTQVQAQPPTARVAEVETPRVARAEPVVTTPWVIQLAAEDNETKAMSLLEQARSSSGRALSRAAPFTERITRGGATLYRARFSGFAEADAAQEACRALKSRGFSCFATRS